jgi:hypothetical protein
MPGFVFDLPKGAEVITADACRLGRVKAVSTGYFEVRARSRASYWLPMFTVVAGTRRRARLTFPAYQLDQYRHAEPMPRAT